MNPLTRTLLLSPTYRQRLADTAPLVWWPFDDGVGATLARDMGDHAYDASYINAGVGAGAFVDGRSSVLLDGASGYVDAYDANLAAAFDATAGTLALWVKPATLTHSTSRMLSAWRNNDDAHYLQCAATNTGDYVVNYVSATVSNGILQAPMPGTGWTHLAITWGDGALALYLNGALADSTTGLTLSAFTPTLITLGNVSGVLHFAGQLAHAALWTRPLTAHTVASLARV